MLVLPRFSQTTGGGLIKTVPFSILSALGGLLIIVACTPSPKEPTNTLHDYVRQKIKSLDPIHVSDRYSTDVASQIFEGLYQYHYLKRPMKVIPAIADGMPEVSKDSLTYTIKIKKGVRFHDSEAFPEKKGRLVKAQDFIYSWKRLADPKNNSEGYWIFDGRIQGLDDWRKARGEGKADYDTKISGLSAKDDHTLVIRLTRPYYQLRHILTMPFTFVVPREAVEKYGKEFTNHPVGSGPFVFAEWIRGSKVVVNKFKGWRGELYPMQGQPEDEKRGLLQDAGKPVPFVDRIVFTIYTEDQPRWLNFLKGKHDFTQIPVDSFDNTLVDGKLRPELVAKKIRHFSAMEPDLVFMAFNMLDPIVGKNKYLRQAISHATNTKLLIKKFYNGQAVSAHGPIPPGIEGYDAKYKNPYKEYNLDKAKALLKKAGYPEGKGLPSLEYTTIGSTLSRQMAELEKQNFARLGINLKIVSTSWPQFLKQKRSKKLQIFGMAWNADYLDGQNFLQLLYGPNQSPGPNGANYDNPKFNELYERALNTPPGQKRTRMYKALRDIFAEDLPYIPQVHRKTNRLYHQWLYNYKYHTVNNNYRKYLRIDAKKRAKTRAEQ